MKTEQLVIWHNPVLAVEIKRRGFPEPLICGLLLVVLWGTSALMIARASYQAVLIPAAIGKIVIYLLWLALPLIAAISAAAWIAKERYLERFLMLRQTHIGDSQISMAYMLVSLYRIRLPLLIVYGLLPVLQLNAAPDGTSAYTFVTNGWSDAGWLLLAMIMGLVWSILAASVGIICGLRRDVPGVWLVGVLSFAVGAACFARMTQPGIAMDLPLWLLVPGFDRVEMSNGFLPLILIPLILSAAVLTIPWRLRTRYMQEGILLVAVVGLCGAVVYRADDLLIDHFVVEHRVLGKLELTDIQQNHCEWPEIECNHSGYVQVLDLRYRDFDEGLPSDIGRLTSVESISLSHAGFGELPTEIGEMKSLRELDLTYTDISVLPSEIGRLSSLEVLIAPRTRLSELPPQIGKLSSLKVLYLGSNHIEELPPEIGQLSSLEQLSLWGNDLTELPPEVGQLSSLQELYVGGNNLRELPPEIGNLISLETLSVWNNPLESAPDEICPLVPQLEIEADEPLMADLGRRCGR